jgi:uncharacterized protein YuzE
LTYDPEADAIYIRLRDAPTIGEGQVHTDVDEHGVITDYDAAGQPVGIELLMVRNKGIDLTALPAYVVPIVKQLLESGAIERGEFVGFE